MNTGIMTSLGDSVLMSFGHVPKYRIVVSHGTSIFNFLVFKCIPVVFSIMDVQIYISRSMQGVYIYHILTNICYSFSGVFPLIFVFMTFLFVFLIDFRNKHPKKHGM